MKDIRLGEGLWIEWEGDNFPETLDDPIVYYTHSWVDINHEMVRGGLASRLQRDGIVDSLSDGYRMIDSGAVVQAFAQYIDGNSEMTYVDDVQNDTMLSSSDEGRVTWVEMTID